MPHLTLQYTANLTGFDPDAALDDINRRLVDSGRFEEAAIESRALALQHHCIGIAPLERAFVHAHLKVLPGRDETTRLSLSQTIVAALQALPPPHHPATQLCVEVTELDDGTYCKLVIDASQS
jgi:5-carboxymethyl-2-hydroxymuconate isomerase